MTKLELARRERQDLKLEDFVGMHNFEGFRQVARPVDGPRSYSYPDYAHLTLIKLDGIVYTFSFKTCFLDPDETRSMAKLGIDMARGPLIGIDVRPKLQGTSFQPLVSMPVEIRTECEVHEPKYGNHEVAEWIYATSDAHEGRVVFEVGNMLQFNASASAAFYSRAELLRRSWWDANGIAQSYLEPRDPDEPEPTPITGGERPHEPKTPGYFKRRGQARARR